ncbi:MAG TPA: proline--tRNA ligase, partial [Lachnospiraceae bacterium]|nr:proline--tRNA ligase [Lachnospiraceae bacterium]
SFHTSQEDLEQYYERCHKAYERVFARAGIPEVISVKSDSGMMGGSVSHEFMLLTPVGEDSIAICKECGFSANMEAAESIIKNEADSVLSELKEVYTPDIHTIEEVCDFLKMDVKKSCKAVVYQKNRDDQYVIVFLRGDIEVNEAKLRNHLGEEVHPGVITEESGINPGYIGPIGLPDGITVVIDSSLEGATNLSCGANKKEYHFIGFTPGRDLPSDTEYADVGKILEGGICPVCGKPSITISRGIEVGNIFQLGTKYTKSMGMTYTDANGEQKIPIMGCYGIGVGRLAASVCEAHHDDYGPIWPMSIAPWQVHLCGMRIDNPEIRETSDRLYEELMGRGLEVIYDDRDVSAGVMFSDADLLGVPVRVIVSPRNLKENIVEISKRDKSFSERVPVTEAAERISELVKKELSAY